MYYFRPISSYHGVFRGILVYLKRDLVGTSLTIKKNIPYDNKLHPKLREMGYQFVECHYLQAERVLMNVHFNGGYKLHSKHQGLAKALVKVCGGRASGGDKFMDAIKLFMRSLLAANGQPFVVAVSPLPFNRKSEFANPTTPPSYNRWVNFLQILVDTGHGTLYLGDSYVESIDDYINKGNRMKSIFVPSDKLLGLVEEYPATSPVDVPVIPKQIRKLKVVECIQETYGGGRIPIVASGVKAYTKEVQAYNSYMAAQRVCDWYGVVIDTQVTRRFKIGPDDLKKDVLKSNGRFITTYMQSPQWQRARFTINGESVVEADYSSCHFRIMYEIAGGELSPEDELYNLDGILDAPASTSRWFAKRAMTLMANSKTPARTLSGIVSKAYKELDSMEDLLGFMELPKELEYFKSFETRPNINTCRAVISQLKRLNPLIADQFTGADGASLMNSESNIAMKVMTRLTTQDIPVLCLHDSFIVPESKGSQLIEAMRGAWKDVLGGSECVAIDWK